MLYTILTTMVKADPEIINNVMEFLFNQTLDNRDYHEGIG